MVGWLRVVCVFFHVYAVFNPEVFYPDVLMEHWPRVVSLFFRAGCVPALSFLTFHFGLISRGLCVCTRSESTFPRFLSIAVITVEPAVQRFACESA